jgi:hypothetical protein
MKNIINGIIQSSFNFKSMNNDGTEMISDKPTIIGEIYNTNIYLMKLDNHYDLLITH